MITMTNPSSQQARLDQEHAFVDIVCEGGGVRGVAFVGALSVLEEHGFQPQNLAGTSAGAIVMALYAAGYRSQELLRLGVYRGDHFYQLMRRLLAAKHVHTFKDLRSPYADN